MGKSETIVFFLSQGPQLDAQQGLLNETEVV